MPYFLLLLRLNLAPKMKGKIERERTEKHLYTGEVTGNGIKA